MKLKLYRAESGQSIVAVALLLAVLCGCVALGVDLGAAHIAKQRMQNAADLAAMAGAKKLYSSAEARQEAKR